MPDPRRKIQKNRVARRHEEKDGNEVQYRMKVMMKDYEEDDEEGTDDDDADDHEEVEKDVDDAEHNDQCWQGWQGGCGCHGMVDDRLQG